MKPGIIDIGSNSVRLCWLSEKPSIGVLPQERLRYSRLGEGETASGNLNEQAVDRTILAVRELLKEASSQDVEVLRISATSALRMAHNRQVVMDHMQEAFGRPVTVLSEQQEATYSYKGAIFGIPDQRRPRVVLDIGGGSTELCWGTDKGKAFSVPVGAVRLYESPDKIGDLHKALEPLVKQAPKGDILLIGVGGTLTTMASVFEQMTEYDPKTIHHLTYGRNAMEQINAVLKNMSLEDRKKLAGMDPARADILPCGLDIALAVMQELFTLTLTVSTTDLLFGQLLELIDKE